MQIKVRNNEVFSKLDNTLQSICVIMLRTLLNRAVVKKLNDH